MILTDVEELNNTLFIDPNELETHYRPAYPL